MICTIPWMAQKNYGKTRVYMVWIHLYDFQEDKKLIYNERKQISGYPGPGGCELTTNEYKKTLRGYKNIIYLDWDGSYIGVYICQN